jgi:hypothetical protein
MRYEQRPRSLHPTRDGDSNLVFPPVTPHTQRPAAKLAFYPGFQLASRCTGDVVGDAPAAQETNMDHRPPLPPPPFLRHPPPPNSNVCSPPSPPLVQHEFDSAVTGIVFTLQ